MQQKVTIIGAGRMGAALIGGWLNARPGLGSKVQAVHVIEPRPAEALLAWAHAGEIVLNPAPSPADILVIAVKPQVFGDVAAQVRSHIGPQTLVLSIMAGLPLALLQAQLGTRRVARAMPNTPGLIARGVTILCLPGDAGPGVEVQMRALLNPLGAVEGPIDEADLPAATAISGCGPAYVYLLAEVMAAAGAAYGLDPALSMRLARGTVEGAGALLAQSDDSAEVLRQNVTSQGGVTEAALSVLMADTALRETFRQAVGAAIARDRALSEEAARRNLAERAGAEETGAGNKTRGKET